MEAKPESGRQQLNSEQSSSVDSPCTVIKPESGREQLNNIREQSSSVDSDPCTVIRKKHKKNKVSLMINVNDILFLVDLFF